MNPIKSSFCILLIAALAGCATQTPEIVDQPVGPDLAPSRISLKNGQGQLVVYSALEVANPAGSDFPTHAGYEIDDANGKMVRRVDNRTGSFYQTPESVSLPPGEYKVKAPATNHGLVTVAVIVKENETTTLDLDGSHFRQHKPTGAGQWVRLPSGEVIGMRQP
jgi:hypothetical protein